MNHVFGDWLLLILIYDKCYTATDKLVPSPKKVKSDIYAADPSKDATESSSSLLPSCF